MELVGHHRICAKAQRVPKRVAPSDWHRNRNTVVATLRLAWEQGANAIERVLAIESCDLNY